MLNYIRFKNLRAFQDSGRIDIVPLTILVGKNSSGKSTIARFLPLLRQSVEVSTRGPILWFGNKYVDFGNFETAIRAGSEEKKIGFEIGLIQQSEVFGGLRSDELAKPQEIRIFLELAEEDKSTRLTSFKISSHDLHIQVKTQNQKTEVTVNDELITGFNLSVDNAIDYGLLPELVLNDVAFNQDEMYGFRWKLESHRKLLNESIYSYIANNSTDESSNRLIKEIISYYDVSYENYSKKLKKLGEKYHSFRAILEFDEDKLWSIWQLSSKVNIPSIISSINQLIDNQMRRVTYVAPVRASAERFYRFQDLQVKELDHTGSNLAMLLHSLSSRQLKDFKRWVKNNLRFEINVQLEGSHYAILIKPEGYKSFHNLSDMGFGFSQVLPVVVSIWMGSKAKTPEEFSFSNANIHDRVIVIEQPELHLHPEMQDILANTIANVAANYETLRVKFLIETHSKTFIDSVGRCIRKEQIKENQISLNIVEHESKSDTSVVRKCQFDSKGQLHDWPLGFFST